MRTCLAILGFGGALLFGAACVASYVRPTLVEEMAARIIRAEVEQRVDARAAEIAAGPLGGLAAIVAERNAAEIARVRRLLEDSVTARVARIAAEMRDPDCGCRTAPAAAGTAAPPGDWRAAVTAYAGERLTALIRLKYLDVSAGLTREFRIFTAANALVLLLLGIAVVVRKKAGIHLLPPAAILVCAAVMVASLYLFQQDWLRTILFSDYVGLGYFGYLGAAFALLADVLLNRARVTTGAINAAMNVFGGAAGSVVPC